MRPCFQASSQPAFSSQFDDFQGDIFHMLTFVRQKQKSVFIKIAFAVIILSFVIGYAMLTSPGDESGGSSPDTFAVSINGQQIPYAQYQQSYSNLYRIYQNIYRDQFTPALEKQLDLRRQALEQLIDQALLLAEAERLGLTVSEQELVASIAREQAFQDNGVFSKARYLQVLNYQRMTPDEFEIMQRHSLLIEKVRSQLQEGLSVTDEEIAAEFSSQNEKVNLAFVRVAPPLFEAKVKITDDELSAWFADNQEKFRIPEQVALSYLLIDPADYEKDLNLSDAEIEKYYQRHLAEYDVPEQVKAAHILIRVPSDADEATRAKKKALADQVLADAKAGKDFAELARKFSDDKGSAAQGGDLGYFTRGTMVAEFEQAAFALQPGSLSDVIETNFGYHVIKAEGYIEAGVKPLEDVLAEVKAGLTKGKSRQLAFETAMDAYNINRKSGDLDAAAAATKQQVKNTGLFAAGEEIPGLGKDPQLSSMAFTLEPGTLARPVNLPQGVLLATLQERQESRLPELSEVRKQVEAAYRSTKAVELAKQTAEKLLSEIQQGTSLADAAKIDSLKVEETGEFNRSYGGFVPRLGNHEALSAAAFAMTSDKPAAPEVFEIGGKFVVANLKKRQDADLTELDETKQTELRTQLTTRKQEQALKDKLEQLREASEIVISPTLQNQLNEG
jgi:peptidyl-prolyl cis-trans isomerase D